MIIPVETPHPHELIEAPGGSLGYVSTNGKFISMYGPRKKVKDVGYVTITKEEGWEISIGAKGVGASKSKARGRTVVMDNLLFSCKDDPKNPDGPIFIQQPWPTDDEVIVRVLQPEAIRGEGAMVRSNLSSVYVIDETQLRYTKRGYLAVEKLAMVEDFLLNFNMESRFESFKDFETDGGNRAHYFVVEDNTTPVKPKGYYITAMPSSEDRTRIICHLKKRANGPVGNALRAVFLPKSPKTLKDWVMAKFPDAKTLLFD